jgi:bifunctional UDP-N-acetylglucosamine pyrophosphorylase/glucosamine-1-phosphate N-acetyltransferase
LKLATIILAAGKGTRMKSSLAKVLHPLHGAPMLAYPVAVARDAGSTDIVIVVGHQAELIEETFKGEGLVFVRQEMQLGTGHAVLQARDHFRRFEGTILILCGDVPLLRSSTVKELLKRHRSGHAAATVMTTVLAEPSGYGRVVKGEDDRILRIVEERDATEEEKNIREINTGIYCVEAPFLFEALAVIDNRNAQGEYYLTDIIAVTIRMGKKAQPFIAADSLEVMGINTREDLEKAEEIIKRRSKRP